MSTQGKARWISVKDRLPALDVKCYRGPDNELVYEGSRLVLAAIVNHDQDDRAFVETCTYVPAKGGWQHPWERSFRSGEPWHEVTHWQPLPDPPAARAKGELTDKICYKVCYDSDDGERFHCQLPAGHKEAHNPFPRTCICTPHTSDRLLVNVLESCPIHGRDSRTRMISS